LAARSVPAAGRSVAQPVVVGEPRHFFGGEAGAKKSSRSRFGVQAAVGFLAAAYLWGGISVDKRCQALSCRSLSAGNVCAVSLRAAVSISRPALDCSSETPPVRLKECVPCPASSAVHGLCGGTALPVTRPPHASVPTSVAGAGMACAQLRVPTMEALTRLPFMCAPPSPAFCGVAFGHLRAALRVGGRRQSSRQAAKRSARRAFAAGRENGPQRPGRRVLRLCCKAADVPTSPCLSFDASRLRPQIQRGLQVESLGRGRHGGSSSRLSALSLASATGSSGAAGDAKSLNNDRHLGGLGLDYISSLTSSP